jgi:hypothetical protein
MAEDDEEYADQDIKARALADRQWKGARKRAAAPSKPRDLDAVDSLIHVYREREMEAAVRGRYSSARWWLVAADTLSERQRDSDESICIGLDALEDFGI